VEVETGRRGGLHGLADVRRSADRRGRSGLRRPPHRDRPQTTLYWFLRSRGPDVLRRMAQGEIEISHEAFNRLPADRTMNYLRAFLAALGVIPAYHAELERLTRWLGDILRGLPKDQADLLGHFTRLHLADAGAPTIRSDQ
jgi:hypothetical protein